MLLETDSQSVLINNKRVAKGPSDTLLSHLLTSFENVPAAAYLLFCSSALFSFSEISVYLI